MSTRALAALILVAIALPCLAGAAGEPGTETSHWGPIEMLGASIEPGQRATVGFAAEESFLGNFLDPVVGVTRGTRPGPTLCVTAGIHGDEINGIEIAHRLYAQTLPTEVSGTLIVIPAVNVAGFRSGSRYLPDRRDLNRAFPGNPDGTVASRIANRVFKDVIRRCSALVDLHTASHFRTNLPQIRTDLNDERALILARSFGIGVVLHGRGPTGSLRRAAMDAGIPAVIYEAGQPLRLEENEISRGRRGVQDVMAHLGMIERTWPEPRDSVVYRKTLWVRAGDIAGMFLSDRNPGDQVARGDLLGTVTDPLTERTEEVRSPVDGTIIGMAVPQVVLAGYGLFHLGTAPSATLEAGTGNRVP